MNKILDTIRTNYFLIFFLAAWLIRVGYVPWLVSKRVGRGYLFGVIKEEEKSTMTNKEKRMQAFSTVVGFFGFVAFFISFFMMYNKMKNS